jgi:ATP-dependent protease Clp ATPase subunit
MYEVPMRKETTHCTITRDMVEQGLHPLEGLKSKPAKTKKRKKPA